MKTVVSLVLLICLAACVGPFDRSPWTRDQLKDWYARWVQRPDGSGPGIGYRGSDAKLHYFMARSMDQWVFIRTPREEIKLTEEHPLGRSSVGPTLVYYWLDPARDFEKKKKPNQAPEPTAPSGRGSS